MSLFSLLGGGGKKRSRSPSPKSALCSAPAAAVGKKLEPVSAAVERLEQAMDSWVDPCGQQYMLQRAVSAADEDGSSVTVTWTGFDKLAAEKLAHLVQLELGQFTLQHAEADLRSGSIRAKITRSGTTAKRARPSLPPPSEETAQDPLLFHSEKDDIRKWLSGRIDQDDMDNLLAYLARMRIYVKQNDMAVQNHRLSYDVKRKNGAYVLLIRGMPLISSKFVRWMTETECPTPTSAFLWLDFEAHLFVIEVTKTKLPI